MAEPLTTAEAKAHLRVTTTAEDDLIDSYIVAARMWIENYTGHILVQREVTDAFSEWGDALVLRHQPITVDDPTPTLTVSYVADGEDVDYDDRVIRDEKYPWRIVPPYGAEFPTADELTSITVTYTAGYANAAAVPDPIKLAMKVLIAGIHMNRGGFGKEAEDCARFLLRSYRGAVLA